MICCALSKGASTQCRKRLPHNLLYGFEPRDILQNKLIHTLQDDNATEALSCNKFDKMPQHEQTITEPKGNYTTMPNISHRLCIKKTISSQWRMSLQLREHLSLPFLHDVTMKNLRHIGDLRSGSCSTATLITLLLLLIAAQKLDQRRMRKRMLCYVMLGDNAVAPDA